MSINIEERCMFLARQYCELNTGVWPEDLPGKPDGFNEMGVHEKDDYFIVEMRKIHDEIYNICKIDPYIVTNYYWNCHFLDDKMEPDDWIRWILFGLVIMNKGTPEEKLYYAKDYDEHNTKLI